MSSMPNRMQVFLHHRGSKICLHFLDLALPPTQGAAPCREVVIIGARNKILTQQNKLHTSINVLNPHLVLCFMDRILYVPKELRKKVLSGVVKCS